jgi:hypothetical protein
MDVAEFLGHVRRLVVDYVVGRVLSRGEPPKAADSRDRLDEPTAYYLLHRNDFGLEDAPVGTVILYAVSCGVSDRELADTWDLLVAGNASSSGDEDGEPDLDDPESSAGSGTTVRLKNWTERKGKSMGVEAPGGRAVPLIDRAHRLMHLWKLGDARKVDEFIDEAGLRRHDLFNRLLQALIELASPGTEERSILESISNHLGVRGARVDEGQRRLSLN